MRSSFFSSLCTILSLVGCLGTAVGLIMIFWFVVGSIVAGLHLFGWTSADVGIQAENSIWLVALVFGGMLLTVGARKIKEYWQ